MKVLIISAHPKSESFIHSLRLVVTEELVHQGHEVREHDLYEDKFNPVLTAYERQNHGAPLYPKIESYPELIPYVEDLKWCDALVLVYPTWWSGQPAIMKGWFDRVLVNEVAWTLPADSNRIRPLLTHIKRFVVVTSHGSSKFINALEGEGGKRTAFRSVRLMMNLRTRSSWIAFYGLDNKNDRQRAAMVTKARRRIRRAL